MIAVASGDDAAAATTAGATELASRHRWLPDAEKMSKCEPGPDGIGDDALRNGPPPGSREQAPRRRSTLDSDRRPHARGGDDDARRRPPRSLASRVFGGLSASLLRADHAGRARLARSAEADACHGAGGRAWRRIEPRSRLARSAGERTIADYT